MGARLEAIVDRFDLLDDVGQPLDASALPTSRAFTGEADPEATVRFRLKGSDVDRWSLVRAHLLEGPDRDQDLVISSFQDITAMKQVERRLSFLLQASALLGETADYHDTLSRIAWLLVPSVADWCAVDVIGDGETVERVAMAHADPELLRAAKEIERRWPPDATQPRPVGEVKRRRSSVHVRDVTDEVLAEEARDADHLDALRGLGCASC